MAYDKVKTEHAGAKNGGGAWTTRAAAKQASRKRRRRAARLVIAAALAAGGCATAPAACTPGTWWAEATQVVASAVPYGGGLAPGVACVAVTP